MSLETNLLEVEEVFRDAGSPVYLIGKPELTIVIGRNVAARKPLRAGGHHGPFMTSGGRATHELPQP